MKLNVSDIEVSCRYWLSWRCPVCGYKYNEGDDGTTDLESVNFRINQIITEDWRCPDCEKDDDKK